MTDLLSKIIFKKQIANGIFDLWLNCPQIAAEALPGQFVNVKCEGFTLRRPISICEIDKVKGSIRIVFEVRGDGTAWLAKQNIGDCIYMLAPLGNGFDLSNSSAKVVFVGGGIGVPPLLAAAIAFKDNATAILGFRNAQAVILTDDFSSHGAAVQLATDDGSAGHHGLVTDLLVNHLESNKCDILFACGPKPMLKAVVKEAQKWGIRCQVSMEEHMACGVGACLCCATKVFENGKEQYQHVCKHGPIFDAEKIVWQ
jgi:dihydroorotate dehydrogenase electron transfer subunit